MKRLAAIFLIILFLFNTIGYRIIFFYAERQSDIQLEASLDKDSYNDADLVKITVPLSLPYFNNQSQFERVDGEIYFNGKIYKYVKRKVTEGCLVLLCLPDYNKMRLNKEKNDFYKDANILAEKAGSKKQESSKGNSFKNILSEYHQSQQPQNVIVFKNHISYNFSTRNALLPSVPQASPEQPPELI